jgi:type I restriction enzyme S subunit
MGGEMNRATMPPGWSVQPLGVLCGKPQYGLTETASRERVGPRFLRITDIQDGEVVWHKVPFCRCSPTDLDRHRVGSGDLLVARIGATTGKTFFVRACPEETVFASYLIRLRPLEVHDRYLYYFCQSAMYWDHINAGKDERLKGGVNTQSLTEVPVMLPPPDEQIVIADVIESIETAARLQSRIATNIRALRSAMMTKLFREGLRGETLRDSDIGPIPESWDVRTVGAVTDPVSGGTPSKQRPEWWQGTVPWASPKDMKKLRLRDTEDHITEEAVEQGSRLVPANTIFIVLRGMILAKDVPVAIADVPMAFNQDMRALMPTGAIDPDFLLYALRVRKSALVQEIGTSAHGTRRMGSASIENLPVPVPRDESEQKEIATVLNDLDKMEEAATAKCSSLKLLFSSMLNQLVTGAISVKDLDLAEVSHA